MESMQQESFLFHNKRGNLSFFLKRDFQLSFLSFSQTRSKEMVFAFWKCPVKWADSLILSEC